MHSTSKGLPYAEVIYNRKAEKDRLTVSERKVIICDAMGVKLQNHDGPSEISFTGQPSAKTKVTLHRHEPTLLCHCFTPENALV
jgi:hypothetical protein